MANNDFNNSADDAATDNDNGSATPNNSKDQAEQDISNTERQSGPDPTLFPDGGWDAWLAVAGGFFSVLASFGWINCMCIAFRNSNDP